MKERIKEIIRVKTNGKQKEFAELLGWSPQYLNRLIKDGIIGLTPVASILEHFPDIDARWLILGTGSMFPSAYSLGSMETITQLLSIEKYIPVMSADEVAQLAQGRIMWEEETIERWSNLLAEKKSYLNNIIACAYARQEELAKQKS